MHYTGFLGYLDSLQKRRPRIGGFGLVCGCSATESPVDTRSPPAFKPPVFHNITYSSTLLFFIDIKEVLHRYDVAKGRKTFIRAQK